MTNDDVPIEASDSVEALREENERLAAELESQRRAGGWRMYAAMVLVVLFGLTLAATNHVVWAATTVLDTDIFVDTLAPLPEDPAVAASLGQRFAERLLEENEVQERIAEALPDGLAFISVPLTESVGGVIGDIASRIISSDAFTSIWETALRVTHRAAMVLVEGGQNDRLVSEDGTVGIDLTPLVSRVDDALTELGIDVLDTDEQVVIVLYESEGLGLVETIVNLVYAIRWAAPILTIVLILGAVILATDRRKVTVWLGAAAAISAVAMLIEGRWLRNAVLGDITDPVYQEGAAAAWSIVFDRLAAQTIGILVLGVVVGLGAWILGPSDRATSMRTRFTDARDGRVAADGSTTFVTTNLRVIQWVVVALGAVLLLMAPTISGLLVIVIAAVVIAAVLALEWYAGGGR